MNYTIEKITTLIGARRYGDLPATISFLLTDSRSLRFPEETLFFALRSERNDGHRYIEDLYRRGVRNFVVDSSYHPQLVGANFLVVPDTLEALQRLAERHRDEFNIPVVGITGSNGKTVVKEWLYQLLRNETESASVITRSPRSYNSQIGVPLSVWLLNENSRMGIFEAGISEVGEMRRLRGIIQPTIGVFTSLGSAHQENFRSLEEKCQEKLQLFHDAETIVYCSDNDIVSRCIRRSGYKGRRMAWSMEDPEAPLFVSRCEVRGVMCEISYRFDNREGSYTLPFIDKASIENSVTCLAIALLLGLTSEQIADGMARLEPIAMRLEVKEGKNGCLLVNDSYNNDVNSLDIALDFMQRRSENSQLKLTLVLSDIYQSGRSQRELYREVAALAKERGVQKLIGIGPEISAEAESFDIEDKHFFPTTDAFVASEVFSSLRNEFILLKGARRFAFDNLTELLVQKVHETILEVNLNAVVDNLNYFRSFLKPDTKMVCMIKADAYGAGAVEIAKTLQEHRVDYLAVAVADEGVALRKAGITANIMVMNPEMTAFKTLFDYELEPEVYSFRLLDALVRAARKEGITGMPVHIKLDTGMHRLGFNDEDIPELIRRLKDQQAVIPRSVFSHFVGSDSEDFNEFSARQFELFTKGADQLQAAFSHHILRHMDNSAGIEHFPERQMDMCRLGIGLYGVDPWPTHGALHGEGSGLQCVSTLKTTILQLRHVPAGDSVGYSRRTILERDSVIGAIPIGYADGLNRRLGNRHGYCLVNGQRAEYVGNICMDVAMIDVTGIPCKEGDMVEIFGENLPVSELADRLETIPYEVLTAVSNRVKRVYFKE
ncbi:MAG: bifunctional UDP-N-acetylmuramoyl-tripeptide:D-alanyl-D-alanine ligase/alanine racemase [Prevotella sp.]|nr:bifunctional UDP-N-acetylmuramoyl-tripeptide:D-alanyl-D-alanine ligase/alanine racemase [Prevotella sp.]MBQ8702345.1 bifunctional UDP-N-acetylmuramoyl-tripeptide:D-alanyl-D-alanine ligase/alanine racemase [Prevotella sp.]